MPHLTADWPVHTLRGPKGPKVAQIGLSGVYWASQVPVMASRGQTDTARPLQVIPNLTLSVSESHFVLQISHLPNIAQKWVCTQNLHMALSFQKKKTVWNSVSWFLRYKANTKGQFFLDAL